MQPKPEGDSIPAAMSRLLDIFSTDLAEVRFGDLDTASLASAAGAVRAAARDLAEAEALADAARASLEAAREVLVQKGQRALAYARIYAEAMPALAERLEGIALTAELHRAETRSVAPEATEATPRRRGRPPKTLVASSELLALEAEASRATNGAQAPTTENERAAT